MEETKRSSRYLESYPKEKMQKDANEWGAYQVHIQRKWGVGFWATPEGREGNGERKKASREMGARRDE